MLKTKVELVQSVQFPQPGGNDAPKRVSIQIELLRACIFTSSLGMLLSILVPKRLRASIQIELLQHLKLREHLGYVAFNFVIPGRKL